MRKQSGNPSSKYWSNPNQLDKDIQDKNNEHEVFKNLIRHLIIRDPAKIDLRFKDMMDVAREIKKEFNL